MKTKLLLHLTGLGAALLSMMAGAQAASISGTVFFDLNGNGVRDATSEYGLPTWTLQLVPVSPAGPTLSTNTDVNGRFTYSSLAAGSYTLSAVHPSPWFQTYPAAAGSHLITLAAGDILTNQNFGCKLPVRVPQIEWQRNFGGSQLEYRGRAFQSADGGYVIAGWSKSAPNFGGADYYVIRLDRLGNEMWRRNYGGTADDVLNSIKETHDGGFILAGNTVSGVGGNKTSVNYGDSDIWIVRIDANGDKVWELGLGGDSWEYDGSVIETQNHGFLVCGVSLSEPGGIGNKTSPVYGYPYDGWIVRLDTNGLILWQTTVGGDGWDEADAAVENPVDGSFLVGGTSSSSAGSGNKTSPNEGSLDLWIMKMDSAGNLLWDRSFGGTDSDYFDGFSGTADGGAVLGAESLSKASGTRTAPKVSDPDHNDCWLVRVDADGNKVWDQAFGGREGQLLRGLQGTSDGGFVLCALTISGITGKKVSPPFGSADAYVAKIDADGNLQWDQTIGGSGYDAFLDLSVTHDGGLLLSGSTGSQDGNVNVQQLGQGDIWVVKLASFFCPTNTLTLLSVTTDCGQHEITVNFSAPLDPTTALQTGNYTLSGGAATVQTVSFGASTLQVVLGVPGLLPGVTYTLAVHGFGDDCGNAIAANAQLTVACPAEIRGKIFSDDHQQNCVQGPGEFTLPNWPVKLEPGPRYTLTDAEGKYSFTLAPGAYTVSAVDDAPGHWVQSCPGTPGTYAIALTNGQIAGARDFGLQPLGTSCADLWVDVTGDYPGPKTPGRVGGSKPCCGAKFTYQIAYGNKKPSATASVLGAVIWFSYPPEVTICPIVPNFQWVAQSVGPQLLKITVFGTLAPGANGVINLPVLLTGDPSVCDNLTLCANQISLNAVADIEPVVGDCDFNNNHSAHSVTPCCSSDPNDCTVTPKGCGPEGLVQRDQVLTYLVQFQNLGGGPAHLVVVNNVLDADLDLSTLEILGSSHPNFLERNGRELKWVFPDIELASVSLDEAASHGYVKFRVRPRADAPVGTMLTNSAEIIFDLNASITTITTTNTITEDPVPRAAFTVVPHPGSAGHTNDFLYTGGTVGAQHRWSFGPDALPPTSTEVNPTGVIFTSPGPHLVALETRLGDCVAEPAVRVVTVGQPVLGIARTGLEMTLYWSGAGYRVEETGSLTPPVTWQTLPSVPLAVGGGYLLRIPVAAGARFYRLTEAP